VTNTGDREGDEVAQLYLRENVTTVETPSRSLAGFSRIRLKPQETKTVTFRIQRSQLAVWNAEGKWAVEPGQFTVWAGGSSQASLSVQFRLEH
jgi:beta-glucosidase